MDRLLGVQEVQTPRICKESANEYVKVVTLKQWSPLPPTHPQPHGDTSGGGQLKCDGTSA